MKKLALVLGSLLVVGSVASAKEVMPAPAPAPEVVVKVVEKPVVVYRDRMVSPKWRPNGSVDLQYRWYGETENRVAGEDGGDWARGKNNYGRLQANVGVNITEKQRLEIRERAFHTWRTEKSVAAGDNLRLRHFYNFGNVASTKINATSRLEFNQSHGDGEKHLEGSVAFDFAEYMFNNDFVKTDSFVLRPRYRYTWEGHHNGYSNTLGLNLESSFSFPLGFSAEFNLYPAYTMYGEKFETDRGATDIAQGRMRDKEFTMDMELYLYNSTELYKNGRFDLSFEFEGGYDPYTWKQYKRVTRNDKTNVIEGISSKRTYSLYALPYFQANYKATDYIKLYAAVGAEYRNWVDEDESTASHWRWQPTAWAGMKVTF